MKIPMAKKHKNDHINKNLEDAQKEFHADVKKKEHTFNDVRSKNTSIPSTTADMSKSKEKISISNTVKHEDGIKSSGIENIESRREHSASYRTKDTSSHSYEPKSQKSQNTGYTNRNLSDVQRQHEEHISSSKIGGGGTENRREPPVSGTTQFSSGHSYEPKSQEPQSSDYVNKNLADAQRQYKEDVQKREHSFSDVKSTSSHQTSSLTDVPKEKEQISTSHTVKHSEEQIHTSKIGGGTENRREPPASGTTQIPSGHSYEPKNQESQSSDYVNKNLADAQRQHTEDVQKREHSFSDVKSTSSHQTSSLTDVPKEKERISTSHTVKHSEERINTSKIGGGGTENRREPPVSGTTQIPSGHSYEPKNQELQGSGPINRNVADAQRQYTEDVQKREHSFTDVKSTSSHQTSSLTDTPKENERISTSHAANHSEEQNHTSRIGEGGTESRRESPSSGTTQIPSGHSYEPKNQEPQSSGYINKNLADAQRQYKEDVQKREHSFTDVKSTSSHQTSSLTDTPKENERISTSHAANHSEERINISRTGGSGTGNKREPPTSGTTQTSSGSNQNSVVSEQKIGKHDIKEDPHINKNVEDAQREFQDTVHKKVQSILEETKKPHQAVPIVVPKNTLKQNGINEKTVVPKITGQSSNRTTIENNPPSEKIGGNGGNKKKNPTHKGNETFTGDTEHTIKNSKTTRKIVSQHGQAAGKKPTINKGINKNVAEAQRAHYERIQEQKNPFLQRQRSEKNTKRSTKDELKKESDDHVLDTVSLGAKETSDTEKSKDKRTAGACALGIKKSNRENVNKEIDFKKFSSPGILGHRIAALERLFIKTGTRFLVDTATQGTDARRGFQSMQDTAGVAAALIADNVMTSISKGFNNHSVRMCAHYNSLLIEAGGEKMYGKYGINTTFHSKKDIRRFQKGLNALLKKQGLAPIKGSGKLLLVNIARYLHRNKAMLTPELKEMIKMLARSARAETLFVNHGRFHALKRLGIKRAARYMRQADAGYALFLTYSMVTKAMTAARIGAKMIRSILAAPIRLALLSTKLAAKGAAKAATAIIKKIPPSAVPETVKKIGKSTKKTAKKGKEIGGKISRISNKIGHYADRINPFSIKKRVRAKRLDFTKQMKEKVLNSLNKTFLAKPINMLTKVFDFKSGVFSAIGSVISTITSILSTMVTILLLLGFFIIIIILILAIISSAFDFSQNDDSIKEIALGQIKECYEQQNKEISDMRSIYRNFSVVYVDKKDEEAYNVEEHQPEVQFTETTNSAEMLSMATVYFDFDLEDAGESKIKDYIKKLYNGSHTTSVSTTTETVKDKDGKSITYTDATVTLTTYYFNSLFDCTLTDKVGILQGSNYAEQVWSYLTSSGFSKECTAAILGNMDQESGVDPTSIQSNGNGPAAGICQWENINERAGRWLNLYNYAQSKGKDWTDLQCQLDFLISELQGGDPTTLSKLNNYYGGFNNFKSSTDIDWAVEAFEKSFERAGKPNMAHRIEAAHYYYDLYKDFTPTSEKGQKIVNAAYSQIGVPYVYGGTTPGVGLDCSGLVQYCYSQAGISIPRTSQEILDNGTIVDNPEPGDICWTPGHVAIYIGNGKMIEAQQDGVPVKESQVRVEHYVRYD